MPKRRMTAARRTQINQWQLAGVKARRKRSLNSMLAPKIPSGGNKAINNYMWKTGLKPYPTGKKTYLYHRTTPASADVLVKTKKWISGSSQHGGLRGRSWFSTGSPVRPSSAYSATAIVGVAVPRQAVRREIYDAESRFFVSVANKDLKGKIVKRLA